MRGKRAWFRGALLGGALALGVPTVAAACGAIANGITVHGALAGVFSNRTARFVLRGSSGPGKGLSPLVIVVSLESTGSKPLASGGPVDLGLSLRYHRTPVGDLVVAGKSRTAYLRLDMVGIRRVSPSAYRTIERLPGELQHLLSASPVLKASPVGRALRADVHALVTGKWLSLSSKALSALGKPAQSLISSRAAEQRLRKALSFSVAQAFHMWASIHKLSSSGGTTVYRVSVPVRHFASTLLAGLRPELRKDGHLSSSELGRLSSGLRRIPAGEKLPVKLWLRNGSVTELRVTYQRESLEVGISHPSDAVVVPRHSVAISRTLFEAAHLFGLGGATSALGSGATSALGGAATASGSGGL